MSHPLSLHPQHGVVAGVARGGARVNAVSCMRNAAAWPAAGAFTALSATATAKRHELRPEEATVG